MYDAHGNMAAQLMPGDFAERTDEQGSGRGMRGFLGYYGKVIIDVEAGIVTHLVEGASIPSWLGRDNVRYYEFTDDGLILSLRRDGRVTGELTWKRF